MREIVLDTETTGLDPAAGDRIVEIACLELVNRYPTGRVWHHYINPEREVPEAAFAVHGLSTAFLSDKPVFASLAEDFLRFIEGATLVIHNAAFDLKFLNAELARLSLPLIAEGQVVDTLAIARRKHPGAQNSLDALCRRYGIDNSARTKHGALLDTELLAEVYVNLVEAQQPGLDFARTAVSAGSGRERPLAIARRPAPLRARLSPQEEAVHLAFVSAFKAQSLWFKTDGG